MPQTAIPRTAMPQTASLSVASPDAPKLRAVLPLDARLTVDAAAALWGDLRGRVGAALDGAQVRHLGAAALQVLLMARMQGGVTLCDPSDAMRAALAEMGAEDLLQGGDA